MTGRSWTLHLLVYLYAAVGAAEGKGSDAAWALYEGWLALAWSGQVGALLKALRVVGERVGKPPAQAKEDDPRRAVWEAVGYVEGNRDKMRYPEYRRLGLPISSAGAGFAFGLGFMVNPLWSHGPTVFGVAFYELVKLTSS
jgi:hypothetical protein